MLSAELKEKILRAQRNEITEHIIYKNLASVVKDKAQSGILTQISDEELRHYQFFKGLSQEDAAADPLKVFIYTSIARVLGLNFGLKLMENGEDSAQDAYNALKEASPEIEKVIHDEEKHENELLSMINEDRLKYVSSVVLGLNDALVEFTGALAGFTLAIQKAKLIGAVGLITGIAASMSMAASEYLSTKHEETDKNPLKASIYTGIAYVVTVLFLISPYLFFDNIFVCLALVVSNALLVIFVFTFYISVAKGLVFSRKFTEMATLSLSIAAISFFIGLIVRKVFGVDV